MGTVCQTGPVPLTAPLRTAPAASFMVAVIPGTEAESPGCRHRGDAVNPRPLRGRGGWRSTTAPKARGMARSWTGGPGHHPPAPRWAGAELGVRSRPQVAGGRRPVPTPSGFCPGQWSSQPASRHPPQKQGIRLQPFLARCSQPGHSIHLLPVPNTAGAPGVSWGRGQDLSCGESATHSTHSAPCRWRPAPRGRVCLCVCESVCV